LTAAVVATQVTTRPRPDDYVTDGTTLAEVIGIDSVGRYELEDAKDGRTFRVTKGAIVHWTVVPRG
jgi:hypothetical protein